MTESLKKSYKRAIGIKEDIRTDLQKRKDLIDRVKFHCPEMFQGIHLYDNEKNWWLYKSLDELKDMIISTFINKNSTKLNNDIR